MQRPDRFGDLQTDPRTFRYLVFAAQLWNCGTQRRLICTLLIITLPSHSIRHLPSHHQCLQTSPCLTGQFVAGYVTLVESGAPRKGYLILLLLVPYSSWIYKLVSLSVLGTLQDTLHTRFEFRRILLGISLAFLASIQQGGISCF